MDAAVWRFLSITVMIIILLWRSAKIAVLELFNPRTSPMNPVAALILPPRWRLKDITEPIDCRWQELGNGLITFCDEEGNQGERLSPQPLLQSADGEAPLDF